MTSVPSSFFRWWGGWHGEIRCALRLSSQRQYDRRRGKWFVAVTAMQVGSPVCQRPAVSKPCWLDKQTISWDDTADEVHRQRGWIALDSGILEHCFEQQSGGPPAEHPRVRFVIAIGHCREAALDFLQRQRRLKVRHQLSPDRHPVPVECSTPKRSSCRNWPLHEPAAWDWCG